MKNIPLYQKKQLLTYTLVDDESFEELSRYIWRLGDTGYAIRAYGSPRKGTYRTVRMHRYIMGLDHGDDLTVDHIDRDKLNNQKYNLRIITKGQNNQNQPSQTGASSKYRGVSWDKNKNKWTVRIGQGSKTLYLGLYVDELEAAQVASDWRAKHMPFSVEGNVNA